MSATAVIAWTAIVAALLLAPVVSAQPQDVSSPQFRFKPQIPKRVHGGTIWLDAAADKIKTIDSVNVQLKTVVVSQGDTLSSILTKSKLRNDLATHAAIRDLNPGLTDVDRLDPAQSIKVPDIDSIFQSPTLGLPDQTRFPTATIVYDPSLTQEAKLAVDEAKSKFDAYRQSTGHSRFSTELELRLSRAIDSAEMLKSNDIPLSRDKRLLLKENAEIIAAAAHQKEAGRGPYPVQHLDGIAGMASDALDFLGGWLSDSSSDPLPVTVKTVGRRGPGNAAAPKIDGLVICVAPRQPFSDAVTSGTLYNPACTEPLSNLPSSPVTGSLRPNLYVYWARNQSNRVSCFQLLTVARSKAADLTRLSVQSDLAAAERAQCYGG